MGAQHPRVSVGLPVYNGERFLSNAFSELLAQDFEDFELIVCDNASNDQTEAICRSFARQDRRVRYHRNERNIGLSANHSLAFRLAQGEFFKWAAYDDGFPQRMLARLVDALSDAPRSVALVYSRCEYIDEFSRVVGLDSDGITSLDPRPHRRLAHYLKHVHMYNCVYGLIRSELLRQTRMWGHYPYSDHVLFAELSMLGGFIELSDAVLRIRRHPGRTFNANPTKAAFREVFTPGRGHRFSLLGLWGRAYLELMRSAHVIPTGVVNKSLCALVALLIPQYWNLRGFGGVQKRKLLRMLMPSAAKP